MSEKSRIQHQLRYVIEGSAWHGPYHAGQMMMLKRMSESA